MVGSISPEIIHPMRAFLDITIFSSPTQALGNATGTVELPSAPVVGRAVPWPVRSATAAEELVVQRLQADAITNVESRQHIQGAAVAVMTDGVCHENEADAWRTVRYLESTYGLVFSEY
jgi:hypothetical protein